VQNCVCVCVLVGCFAEMGTGAQSYTHCQALHPSQVATSKGALSCSLNIATHDEPNSNMYHHWWVFFNTFSDCGGL
jgi:predicted naringenin-chalcone synthase